MVSVWAMAGWLLLSVPCTVALQTEFGVEGGSGRLMCNTTAATPILVMWFKDQNLNPFYSYDARALSEAGGAHWSDSALTGRVSFMLSANSSLSVLTIKHLEQSDQALYRCRVDYKQAPTTHWEVSLEIFVPPSKPVLVGEEGNQINKIIGTFFEGDQVMISCEVKGGRPKPWLWWIKDGEPVKAATEISSGSVVTSKLILDGVRRVDNNQTVACLTNNNEISQPARTSALLMLNLAPLSATISNKLRKLLAGKDYNFSCLARGASPSVQFRWFLGDTELQQPPAARQDDQSLVRFRPTRKQHGQTLRCQASNPALPLQSIQDSLVLDIYYPPVLSLRLGPGLDSQNIREGSDVYLECGVAARPRSRAISWLLEGEQVDQDLSRGRLVSGSSLVLQNISRADGGRYTCQAHNSEGRSTSNSIAVDVKYRPVCEAKGVTTVLAVDQGEEVAVPCRVMANPDTAQFHWFFNSSDSQEFIDLPESQFSSSPGRSVLQFSLHSERDYGVVECRARNPLGLQVEPCLTRLVARAAPARPAHCAVLEQAGQVVLVECEQRQGGPGGVFVLELYRDSQLTQLARNSSQPVPRWRLPGLLPGRHYTARIYRRGPGGVSSPVLLRVSAHQEASRLLILPPEEETGLELPADRATDSAAESSLPFPFKVILFALLMIAFILVVFSASVGAICRIQCKIVEESARLEVKTQSTATSPMGSSSSLDMPHLLPRSPRHHHQLSSQSTEALLYSGAAALTADNLSFSSFEVLPAVAGTVRAGYSATLPRRAAWQQQQQEEEEDSWPEQRARLEKQRSVTFGAIDLLEPIEEDFPQESRV